jgi:hypothetical protein
MEKRKYEFSCFSQKTFPPESDNQDPSRREGGIEKNDPSFPPEETFPFRDRK